jgi:membrane fusion protein, multidrug efflux system
LATGSLAAIDNQVDSTTGTVRLKAVFPNEDNLLFPNQFVNGRLLVETRAHAVVVPSAAVQRGPDSMFAYVLQPDATVDLRKIVVGPTEGDQTIIEEGLAVGETVVIDGVDKLQKGSKVAPRGSDAVSGAQPQQPREKAGAKDT